MASCGVLKWASPENVKCRKQICVQRQNYWSLTVNFSLIVLPTSSTQKFSTDILCSPAISAFPTSPRFHHTRLESFCLPLVLALLRLRLSCFPTFVNGRNLDFPLKTRDSQTITLINVSFKLIKHCGTQNKIMTIEAYCASSVRRPCQTAASPLFQAHTSSFAKWIYPTHLLSAEFT